MKRKQNTDLFGKPLKKSQNSKNSSVTKAYKGMYRGSIDLHQFYVSIISVKSPTYATCALKHSTTCMPLSARD